MYLLQSISMLSVFMQSPVFMVLLSDLILNVVMLDVIMLSLVVLIL